MKFTSRREDQAWFQIEEHERKAQILKINRRLKAAAKEFGIPLHQVRTKRGKYKMNIKIAQLWNVESNTLVRDRCDLAKLDEGTRCMIKRNFAKGSKPDDVIVDLIDLYRKPEAAHHEQPQVPKSQLYAFRSETVARIKEMMGRGSERVVSQ